MKRLVEFIKESQENKTFSFSFNGLENAKETLESLEKIDYVTTSVDDEKASVLVNKDNANKMDTFQDIMQQYIDTLRKSTKIASDEQYAQKVKSFANKFNEFVAFIDELQNSEDETNDESKDNKDDKKEEE